MTGKLKTSWEFERVFARGNKFITADFALHCLPTERDGIKIGVCVGKSLANAVKRNRMKRRLREIIRRIEFPPNNFHIALVARKRSMKKDFLELTQSVMNVLSKAHLI